MIPGPRCYIDASLAPDMIDQQPRSAGLGIFLLNLQEPQAGSLYIKAHLNRYSSVLMAEAASLALATTITDALNLTGVSSLSDNEVLVRFLNREDQTYPPEWRIRPYTHLFQQASASAAARIYKIPRSLNTTADQLARQAFRSAIQQQNVIHLSCSNGHHLPICSSIQALQNVAVQDVTISAIRCCY